MSTDPFADSAGARPPMDERRLRLQSAYLVMIRAYLRRQQASLPGNPAAGSEAKHA